MEEVDSETVTIHRGKPGKFNPRSDSDRCGPVECAGNRAPSILQQKRVCSRLHRDHTLDPNFMPASRMGIAVERPNRVYGSLTWSTLLDANIVSFLYPDAFPRERSLVVVNRLTDTNDTHPSVRPLRHVALAFGQGRGHFLSSVPQHQLHMALIVTLDSSYDPIQSDSDAVLLFVRKSLEGDRHRWWQFEQHHRGRSFELLGDHAGRPRCGVVRPYFVSPEHDGLTRPQPIPARVLVTRYHSGVVLD